MKDPENYRRRKILQDSKQTKKAKDSHCHSMFYHKATLQMTCTEKICQSGSRGGKPHKTTLRKNHQENQNNIGPKNSFKISTSRSNTTGK